MAQVYDMITGKLVAFYVGMSSRESVICAYEQLEHRNFNHWDYDFSKAKILNDKIYYEKYFAIKD